MLRAYGNTKKWQAGGLTQWQAVGTEAGWEGVGGLFLLCIWAALTAPMQVTVGDLQRNKPQQSVLGKRFSAILYNCMEFDTNF